MRSHAGQLHPRKDSQRVDQKPTARGEYVIVVAFGLQVVVSPQILVPSLSKEPLQLADIHTTVKLSHLVACRIRLLAVEQSLSVEANTVDVTSSPFSPRNACCEVLAHVSKSSASQSISPDQLSFELQQAPLVHLVRRSRLVDATLITSLSLILDTQCPAPQQR